MEPFPAMIKGRVWFCRCVSVFGQIFPQAQESNEKMLEQDRAGSLLIRNEGASSIENRQADQKLLCRGDVAET